MTRLDWRDFGAVGDGTADSTQAINDCFQAAMDTGMEAYGPAGTYKITAPLVWGANPPRISGAGSLTIIKPDANDFDWLTIGDGTTVGSGPGTGWVRDLIVRGANTTLAPPGSTAGLVLNAMRGIEVRNVQVDYAPIGFDLRNNCFGSSFYGCRTLFDRCRIGIDLRGNMPGVQFESGNDQSFFYCWFHGRDAGVKMSRGGGFYRFFGGQIANIGGAAPNDANGSLVVDITLPGAVAATFHSMSFEHAANGWNVRVLGVPGGGVGLGAWLTFDACSFFAGPGAIGVLKISDPYDEMISLRDSYVQGTYSAASLIDIPNGQTANPNPSYIEMGSHGRPSVNGGTIDLRDGSMLSRSALTRGFSMNFHHLWFNGVFLRTQNATDDLQISGDGVVWTSLAKVP